MDDRDEWLEWRRQGLGGSDIPIILGLTSWGSPGEVWASKVDPEHPGIVATERMQWGNILENIVIDEWARRHDIDPETIKRQVRVEHAEHPWRRATLDGLRDAVVVEAKNTSERPWDTLPEHYRAQNLWQIGNTPGATEGVVIALHQGIELVEYPVEFDADLYERLAGFAAKFWQNVLDRRHPNDAIEATETIKARAIHFADLRERRLALAKEEDAAKAELLLALDGHPEAHVNGAPLVTDKTTDSGQLDTAALIEAHARLTRSDAETVKSMYLKPKPTRRVNVVAKTLEQIAS